MRRRRQTKTRKKLADFFKCDIDDVFPAQMVGNITKEQYDRRKAPAPHSHRLATLRDFLPNLRFRNEAVVGEILDSMSLDELGDLFHSGLDSEEALDHLRRAGKKYGLAEPKIR